MNNWIEKALGKDPKKILQDAGEPREASPEEEFVILLQGKNNHGDEIYSYLKMQFKHLDTLQTAIVNGTDFTPSDFGTVLAAGLGDPSDELRQEMAVTHNLVNLKPVDEIQNNKPMLGGGFSQPVPSLWDED